MGFKINQQSVDEPVYCDYIQEKVDVAKKHNATYELVDEDIRIQALYDNENLITKDVVKQLNRVKVNQKQYLTVNKNVDFFTRSEGEDKNQPGDYFDRYSTIEGIVEIPVKTSVTASSDAPTPTRIEYTIPFTKENVNKYLTNNDGIIYRFYEGTTTSNRTPQTIPSVTNVDYFKDATWDELLIGREKKVLNSMVNRLPEIRKELPPKEEVNNKKEDKEIVVNSEGPEPSKLASDKRGNTGQNKKD